MDVDIRPVKPDQLADANPRGIKHFQHRAIALVEAVFELDRIQQVKRVVNGKKFRQRLFLLGRIDQQQRIFLDPLGRHQIAKEPFQRRQLAAHRTLLAMRRQGSEISSHHMNVDFSGIHPAGAIQRQLSFDEKTLKLRQVAQIIAHRVRRHITLVAQVRDVLLD